LLEEAEQQMRIENQERKKMEKEGTLTEEEIVVHI
jgi:hypothetical protein